MIIGGQLLAIQLFLDATCPNGLLHKHCKWSAFTVERLHQELSWFRWVYPLAALIGDTSYKLDASGGPGGAGILGIVVSVMALAALAYLLFTPAGDILRATLDRRPDSLVGKSRKLWLSALGLVLPALLLLWLAGYSYTAEVLSGSFIDSFWLVLWLMMLHGLLTRALQLNYQRLEHRALLEKREAAPDARATEMAGADDGAAPEDTDFDVEEPEVNLGGLNKDSRFLLTAIMFFVTIFWLLIIWAPLVPILASLQEISFWSRSALVDGETVELTVSLKDILIAALFAVGTVVAVKGLPSLLELVLLHNTRMTTGGRYTATTLLRYVIIGVGALIVLSILGVSWSKAQWLVAALGVGIGFGLQEIVANFISGLVILFERPIRVGDIVTVGETSGVVTRIQIRATTIRDWDRRELLVPNKSFITGRLLNWSLSDDIIRLLIPVGVAYGSDVMLAMKLAEEAASEHPNVLEDPAPRVAFEGFGDNALQLGLRAYLPSVEHRLSTLSELNTAINEKYEAAGVVIAFPQRDIHLYPTTPIEVRML